MTDSKLQLTPGGIATLACLMEVTAPKPGNVHRSADFEDTTFMDFSTSAVVFGQVIDANVESSLGETILTSVKQTRLAVGTNTNLGIILLLTPLAKILKQEKVRSLDQSSVHEFMTTLGGSDGSDVFEAIRIAKPGGIGSSDRMDVQSVRTAPVDLLQAMEFAKDRDSIARQYVTGFQTVFEVGISKLREGIKLFPELSQAIVFTHVAMMANEPDSLIGRKCGDQIAKQSQTMALKAVENLDCDIPSEEQFESFWSAVGELDFWLRSDGHRRNPGTTADLIAATLFVAINNGIITVPLR